MGMIESYRKRRAELTGPESVATLEHMQEYFKDGANWTQSSYANGAARCLVGAANHVRVSSIDDAKHWLRLAIAEVDPGITRIEDFNDTRSTFAEVGAVIERARQLAAESVALALPPPAPVLPAPVVEILPPEQAALNNPIIAQLLGRAAPNAPPVFLEPEPLPRARVRPRRSLVGWILD